MLEFLKKTKRVIINSARYTKDFYNKMRDLRRRKYSLHATPSHVGSEFAYHMTEPDIRYFNYKIEELWVDICDIQSVSTEEEIMSRLVKIEDIIKSISKFYANSITDVRKHATRSDKLAIDKYKLISEKDKEVESIKEELKKERAEVQALKRKLIKMRRFSNFE